MDGDEALTFAHCPNDVRLFGVDTIVEKVNNILSLHYVHNPAILAYG